LDWLWWNVYCCEFVCIAIADISEDSWFLSPSRVAWEVAKVTGYWNHCITKRRS